MELNQDKQQRAMGTVEPKDEEDGKPKPKPKPKSKIPKAKTPVQEATCVF